MLETKITVLADTTEQARDILDSIFERDDVIAIEAEVPREVTE